MKIVSAAIIFFAASIGTVCAEPAVSSTVDNKNQSASHDQHSPGTVGSMTRVTQGVATNPDEIRLQQEGSSIEQGSHGTGGNKSMTKQSPGTVGASPGYTANRAD